MRLTLRTMLAYLDDILDPQDAEQLRKKIEDSEFASSLVRQIQGSVRHTRLDAPALDAQGIGGDLNSVAEYLDNVLPPEQVPALEKACLESEVNLGEVASCHQILTLVLGEPADASDRMRAQAYSIAQIGSTEPSPSGSEKRIDASHGQQLAVGRGPGSPVSSSGPGAPSSNAKDAENQVVSAGRLASPVDVPSTRETWRAEAQQVLGAQPSDTPSPEWPEEDQLPVGRPLSLPSSPAPYPEYLDRKASLLRSACITGLVAMLILAGLLFATSPIENNLIARWRGTATAPVAEQGNESSDVDGTDSASRDEPIEIEVVQPVQPEGWNADEQTAVRNDSRFAASPTSETSESDDAQVPTETLDSTEATMGEGSLPSDVETPEGQTATDSEGIESSRTDDGPELEPGPSQLVRDQTNELERHVAESSFDDEGLDVVVVEPRLPTKDEIQDVPRAPTDSATSIARSEGLSTPPMQDRTVPIVDPGIDVESEPIRPSVARAVPNSSALESVATTDLPDPDSQQSAAGPPAEPANLKYPDQLLLTFNPQSEDWSRVEPATPLEVGDFLLGLPAFRADIEFGSGVDCSLVDATRVQLGPGSDLTIHDGRLLLRNAQPEISKAIQFFGDRFEIEFADADGLIAVEASRLHVPGTDPEEVPHTLLKIFALTNNVVVHCKGNAYDVSQGSHLVAFDDFEPRMETTKKRPGWTTSSSISTAESNAVRSFKQSFDNSQNIRLWLREQANRRYGDRALAARCLAELDEFDAIISALNDPEQRAFWNKHFASLRRALTRGRQTIDSLRLELERAHGDRAEFMMEMIRGYNGRQLAAGAAAKLVRHLEHPQLDHRVLAIQNLKNITGYSLTFRPEKPAGYRGTVMRRWKGRLSSGKIVYNDAPEVVALLESFAN